jgi:hypothetical protein
LVLPGVDPLVEALRPIIEQIVHDKLRTLGYGAAPAQFLSTKEAAAAAGKCQKTIRRWIAAGHLKAQGDRIERTQLEAVLRQGVPRTKNQVETPQARAERHLKRRAERRTRG